MLRKLVSKMGILQIGKLIEERDVFESLDKLEKHLNYYHNKNFDPISQIDDEIDFCVIKKALMEWKKIKEAGKSEGIKKALNSLKRYHNLDVLKPYKDDGLIVEDYEDYKNIENALLSKVSE